MCYESLASLLTSLGQTRQADLVQVQLSHWLKANPQKPGGPASVDLSTLRQAEPTVTFAQFVDSADLWGAAVRKVRGLPQEEVTMAMGEEEEGREETQNVLVVQDDDLSNVDSGLAGSNVDSGAMACDQNVEKSSSI